MIMKAAGSIFDRRWWVAIPDRRSQELKLPASVYGVARSNQASLLELRSWLNPIMRDNRKSSYKQTKAARIRTLILIILLAAALLFGCRWFSGSMAGGGPLPGTSEKSEYPGRTPANAEEFLAELPEWQGYAFAYVNGNKPDFSEDEIWTSTQEYLEPLDKLGRCGRADSCIGTDGMPAEPRGDISSVIPTGWHTERYDFVEGEALYNRCHLIAHQLSGDDAVPRNLITGTSYMNRDGMLQFENAVGNYVRNSGNHVMYRVEPVFIGKELVARGVHMEAVSVEDGGAGLSFNVYCYNVQPGIDIDYATGDNKLSDDDSALREWQAGRFSVMADTHGRAPENAQTSAQQEDADEADAHAETDKTSGRTEASDDASPAMTYVLNTNTGKFHYPDCQSVADMSEHNKKTVEASRDDLISRGFEPCGNCRP